MPPSPNRDSKSSLIFLLILVGLGLLFPIIAAFPNSPSWSWDFAKLSILLLNVIVIAVMFSHRPQGKVQAYAYPFLLCSSVSVLLVIGREVIGFRLPRIAWQFMDIYCVVSFVVAVIIARNSRSIGSQSSTTPPKNQPPMSDMESIPPVVKPGFMEKISDHDWEELRRDYPTLATWFMDPKNYAVGWDDLDSLKKITRAAIALRERAQNAKSRGEIPIMDTRISVSHLSRTTRPFPIET